MIPADKTLPSTNSSGTTVLFTFASFSCLTVLAVIFLPSLMMALPSTTISNAAV